MSRALHGRVTPWAAAGVLFVFNYALHLGMLSFLFASGLALWAFAAYLVVLGRSRGRRFVFVALAALVLLVAHLYGFAVFAVLVGVHALAQVRFNVCALMWRAAPFVPALAAFAAFSPTAEGPTFIKMPDATLKVLHLAHLSLFDSPLARAGAIVLVAAFVIVFALKRRTLFAKHLSPVVAVLLGLYVVLPHVVLSSGNADWRLLTPLALVVCAALAVPLGRKVGYGVLAGVVVLGVVQSALVYDRWRLSDAHQTHMMQALAELPKHPQMVANGSFAHTEHPVAGRLCEPRDPARFSKTPSTVGDIAPTLGQHTDEILREIGLASEVESLRAERVVG